ncbi:MAG: putative kinase [Eubacterium sp.]|jgi:predicted kinase|nr:putative kinase [Eubacterium sp.]
MQAIIFTGIQATGKSTFYRENFINTHIRINLDMLRTRARESIILEACIKAGQAFVVDNTNPTAADRRRYIDPAHSAGFKVIGYYFHSDLEEAINRNSERKGKEYIPLPGIRNTHSKLEPPRMEEGFDQLFYVSITKEGKFIVDNISEN